MSAFEDTYVGRMDAATAWDPLHQELVHVGGTIGCAATACGGAGLNALLFADGDITRTDTLFAANSGRATTVLLDGMGATVVDNVPLVEDWVLYQPKGSPTFGVRAGTAAFFGLAWDQVDKEWFGAPELVAWGGTFHQDVAPNRTIDVWDFPHQDASVLYWPDYYLDPNESDPSLFQVDNGLRDVDLLTGTTTSFGVVPWAYDGAMVDLAEDRLVTVGGLNSLAQNPNWVRIVDYFGNIVHQEEISPTNGLAGIRDPIDGAAWFFGAFGSSPTSRLLEVQADDGPVYIDTSSFEIRHWEAFVQPWYPDETDPTVAQPGRGTAPTPWWVHTAFVFTPTCGDDDPDFTGCFTQKVWLELSPNLYTGSNNTEFSIELVLPPADATAPRLLLHEAEIIQHPPVGGRTLLEVRTPLALVRPPTGPAPEYGLIVKSKVTPAVDTVTPLSAISDLTWTKFGHPLGACGESWAVSVQRWWTTLRDGTLADQSSGPFGGVRIRPPDGMTVVGPGYDPGCTNTTMRLLSAPDPAVDACLDLTHANAAEIEETFNFDIRADTTYAGGGPTAHFWVDTCLDADVQGVVDDWIHGAGDLSYQGASSFLAARIGTGTSTQPAAIWLGRPEVWNHGYGWIENYGGYTRGPNVRLHPFAGDGTLGGANTYATSLLLDSTATHELAHLVLNHRRYSDPAVRWFHEAAPTLLSHERQPGVNAQQQYAGLFQRVNAFIYDDDSRVVRLRDLTAEPLVAEPTAVELERDYRVGPYLLAQVAAAASGNDSTAFWSDVSSSLQSQPFLSPYAPSDLHTLLDYGLERDLPGVYDARIRGQTFGEPLLGITSHTLDGGAVGDVRVEQVQTNLVSRRGSVFAQFTEVPYVLGCQTLDGALAYNECTATLDTWLGPLATLSTASVDVTLTAAPGVDTQTGDTGVAHSTQAVWVGLLANSRVLPGAMPHYGVLDGSDAPPAGFLSTPSAATWQLFCGRGSVAAYDCSPATPDLDLDGHRIFGDCDDLDASIHPGAPDPVGPDWGSGDMDRNCDGWPVDFWITPPALSP